MMVYFSPIFFPEVQTDPFIYIIKSVDFRLTGISIADALPYLSQAFRCHAPAIVGDPQDTVTVLHFPINADHTLSPFVLNAVVQRIFHQRLQCDLGYPAGVQFFRHADFILENILIAHLLDFQIAAHMLKLFPDIQNILSLI